MGDLLCELPTDTIPPTESEKQAFSLLFGSRPELSNDKSNDKSNDNVDDLNIKKNINNTRVSDHTSNSSLPIQGRTIISSPSSPPSTSVSSRRGWKPKEIQTICLLTFMFAICTFTPFVDWISQKFSFLSTMPYLYWVLKIFFFAIFTFFVLNLDAVMVPSSC